MPNIYKRKGGVQRGNWTAQALHDALAAVENGLMGINEAARTLHIPPTTLKRRKKDENPTKQNRLGPYSSLGENVEAKLVQHIKKLQKFGFAPARDVVRKMAYDLAEKMNIKHKFNRESGKAGFVWLQSFLRRHPDLSIRKSEGVSLARSQGMSRKAVRDYFDLLENILSDNDLLDKPGNIYNMDETGLQLNNKPGQVIAARGSKSISAITSGEKGETISVVACCNAEGSFLPPYCIFKGKNKKDNWADGMPPGAMIRMSPKSAYVNAEIFLDWLKNHLLPRKRPGKVLLLLDGHTSHTNSIDVLEFAENNDIILLCFPGHTTHYLQPLDRAFFKSLKSYYYAECNKFIRNNPARKLNRTVFGTLLGNSWNKAATVQNATAAFRATGVVPLNRDAIPEYAFLMGTDDEIIQPSLNGSNSSQQSSSHEQEEERSHTPIDQDSQPTNQVPVKTPNKKTPGKILDEVSPVPDIRTIGALKKRGRNVANILNSPANIKAMKEKNSAKKKKGENIKDKVDALEKKTKKKTKKKRQQFESSDSSMDYESPDLNDSDDSDDEDYENTCAGCGENYMKTKKTEDWIKCIICGRWMHENCSKFENLCDLCGKHSKK